jgi:predicted transcriptional regulator
MPRALTIQLDEDTTRQLAELAEHYRSRSAAVQEAIRGAWRQLQEEKLDAGYTAAAAENPHYPCESAEEAAVLRARRRSGGAA